MAKVLWKGSVEGWSNVTIRVVQTDDPKAPILTEYLRGVDAFGTEAWTSATNGENQTHIRALEACLATVLRTPPKTAYRD